MDFFSCQTLAADQFRCSIFQPVESSERYPRVEGKVKLAPIDAEIKEATQLEEVNLRELRIGGAEVGPSIPWDAWVAWGIGGAILLFVIGSIVWKLAPKCCPKK